MFLPVYSVPPSLSSVWTGIVAMIRPGFVLRLID